MIDEEIKGEGIREGRGPRKDDSGAIDGRVGCTRHTSHD